MHSRGTRARQEIAAIAPHSLSLTQAFSLAQVLTRIFLLVGFLWSGPPSHAYQIYNRWFATATNPTTGSRGDAITLTWGFVADGTNISGNGPSSGSTLISFLDTQIGAGQGGANLTQRPWFNIFASSFGRLSELSGVSYVYEPNNTGQPIDSSPSPTGQLGVRPDVRIGGHSIDGRTGANTLAYSYFPGHSDLVLDVDNTDFFANPANNYRAFRNILMHEGGHGLGINHLSSNNAAFLMEPILNNNFDGPQLDDILGLHRNYGDALEKNGGNDVFGNATTLGSLADGSTLARGIYGDTLLVLPTQSDFVSIDGTSDNDFYSFTLVRPLTVTVDLTPRGAVYNQGPEGGTQVSQNTKAFSDLTLSLFAADGSTLVGEANNAAAGFAESLMLLLDPGTYYTRVAGFDDEVQLYGLQIAGTRVAADLVWTALQSDVWDVTTTDNFSDSIGPVRFYDQDRVTFDDTATISTVNIAENVQPSNIKVNTAGSYTFMGPGGIVGGSLTLTGGGSLEIGNDGNAYAGATNVEHGTLIVSSSTGTGDTTVHDGARLGGSGTVGGNLIADAHATILPGTSLLPSSTAIEQDDTLTVDGNFTHSVNAVLELELRSVGDFDAVIVTGSTSLAGTLSVHLGEEFTATAGDRFEILTSIEGITGTFAELLLPDLGETLALNAIYEANTLALTVIPQFVVVPGDFDGDGDVDGRDFLAWQRGDSPNALSAEDLAEWQANYAPSEAASAAVLASVPEPSTGVVLIVGIATWLGPWCRR